MNQKFKRGFGVVEVLVSSVIIITILMALVFVGRTALANSSYTQEKAQAVYLAQEGIEIVRQIRDTYWIDEDNATNFGSLVASTGVQGTNFNTTTHKYELDNSADTIVINYLSFSRTITLESIENTGSLLPGSGEASTDVYPANNALKVTSIVSWTFNGVQKSISASEVLTNWRPNF